MKIARMEAYDILMKPLLKRRNSMPSGKIHDATTTALAVTAATTLFLDRVHALDDPFSVVAYGTGFVVGLFIGPDLDIDRGNSSHRRIRKTFFLGPLLEKLWFVFWWPYAKLVKHRSPLSHAPILGTLLRMGYIIGLCWLLGRLLQLPSPPAISLKNTFLFLTSLCQSDLAHWLLDRQN